MDNAPAAIAVGQLSLDLARDKAINSGILSGWSAGKANLNSLFDDWSLILFTCDVSIDDAARVAAAFADAYSYLAAVNRGDTTCFVNNLFAQDSLEAAETALKNGNQNGAKTNAAAGEANLATNMILQSTIYEQLAYANVDANMIAAIIAGYE